MGEISESGPEVLGEFSMGILGPEPVKSFSEVMLWELSETWDQRLVYCYTSGRQAWHCDVNSSLLKGADDSPV